MKKKSRPSNSTRKRGGFPETAPPPPKGGMRPVASGAQSPGSPQSPGALPSPGAPASRAKNENQKSQIPQSLPLGRGVTIIASDPNGLIAFNKPAGILSHPNIGSDRPRSLLAARYNSDEEFYECGAPPARRAFPAAGGKLRPAAPATSQSGFKIWLLNRLDSATSGVILAATNEKLAREIRALFQARRVRKTYIALVFGVPQQPAQIWRDTLAIDKSHGQIRASTRSGNIPSETRMQLLRAHRDSAAGTPVSLLQLEPSTGRSHQLRVQCAKRRLPIIGDATYGNFRDNRDFARLVRDKRLFLHSFETQFEYAHEGRAHTFSARAELPAVFAAWR